MSRQRLRRELRLLKLWAGGSSLLVVAVSVAAFRQPPAAAQKNLGEITVERINVVDRDGTLRLVIADKDRMHPGAMDGRTIRRPRPVAGLLFFNDEGDEVGGLTYTGRETGETRTAEAGLMFDQLKQDQTIGISYTEGNGQRRAGFQVWDRPDSHLSALFDEVDRANRLTDPAARQAALDAMHAKAPKAHERVYVGKQRDRAAVVSLGDAEGRPRLRLHVEADGAAAIEFLDENGKVTDPLPR